MSPQFDLILLLLLAVGIVYAVHIYKNPPKEGWTFVSVIIGDGITDIGMSALIATVLMEMDYWEPLWGLVFIPWLCHGFTGIPMIIGQLIFKWKQDRKIEEIINGQ